MWERLIALMRLGKTDLAARDDGPVRLLQVREGGLGAYGGPVVAPSLPHVQEFGFASSPPVGTDVLLVASQGDRTRTIIAGTNHGPSRPRDLQPGDTAMHDVRGARVWLTADGLVIDGAGLPATIRNVSGLTITSTGPVVIDAPTVEVKRDMIVDGNLTAANVTASTGSVYARNGKVELGALADAYDGHHHTGVKAGTDTSGGPDAKV